MDKVLSHISQYVSDITYEDLPADITHQTKRLWLDTLACTPRAFSSPPVQIGVTLAEMSSSKSPATVLWGQQQTTAEMAAFVNSSMVRYLDFNDFYQGPEAKESGHPSDAFPSALSVAEQERVTGKEVLLGSVIAWEIYARLADRVPFRDYGFDQSIAIAIASTCSACKVMGLSQDETANAIALTTASNITLGEVRFGEVSMWKGCAAANGVRNGVFSASLAKQGMTGPLNIFDGPRGFFHGISGEFELGKFGGKEEPFRIMQASMKHFAVGAVAQTALECILELRSDIDSIHKISEVEVRTFQFGVNVMADVREKWSPLNRETADHSLPYCVAIMLLFGEINDDYFSDGYLGDETVRELMKKINVVSDESATQLFPEKRVSKVLIRMDSGVEHYAELGYHKGHPSNAMSDVEVENKFREQTDIYLNESQANKIISQWWTLDTQRDLSSLVSSLVIQK